MKIGKMTLRLCILRGMNNSQAGHGALCILTESSFVRSYREEKFKIITSFMT